MGETGAGGVRWTVDEAGEGHPIEETSGSVPSNADTDSEMKDFGCSPRRGKDSEEGGQEGSGQCKYAPA